VKAHYGNAWRRWWLQIEISRLTGTSANQIGRSVGFARYRRGRCTRFLLLDGVFSTDDAVRHLSLSLSRASDPAHSAAWSKASFKERNIAGKRRISLQIVDQWLCGLGTNIFNKTTIIRRTLRLSTPERRLWVNALSAEIGRK